MINFMNAAIVIIIICVFLIGIHWVDKEIKKDRKYLEDARREHENYLDGKKKEIELLYKSIQDAIKSSYEMDNILTNDDHAYVLKTVDVSPVINLNLDEPDAKIDFHENLYQLNRFCVNKEAVMLGDRMVYEELIKFMINNGIIKTQIVDGKVRILVHYYVKQNK